MGTRTLLDPTGDSEPERAVMSDPERPGSWFGDEGADGRMLTQEQTDMLVRAELWECHSRSTMTDRFWSTYEEMKGILGEPRTVPVTVPRPLQPGWDSATRQRGGIDSGL